MHESIAHAVRPAQDYVLLQLVEVVLDLGRPPYARLPQGDVRLSEAPVSQTDLTAAVSMVSVGTDTALLHCCTQPVQEPKS